MSVSTGLERRIERVLSDVGSAAERAGRDPGSVTIVAVCKTVGREVVDAAYQAGLRHFGENRVQDAAAKFAEPLPADATLHMIGQLQTNKANVAARLFQIIESVDRASLITELDKQAAKLGSPIPVLLQVNIAGEEQKSGCEPSQTAELVSRIRQAAGLELRGLMTIAPLVTDTEDVRPVFRGLRNVRDELAAGDDTLDLSILSMGMSNDYKVAIEEGATHVRIGRAIFEG
ncbi:MAG: YggS family pyridoxal phosphate-dependent enzyme [Thermomicrobiales bacterium]|nr:YggS family pyridoxal phosphate-dependent enzyme [Thermomicrobiales bacterium]